MFWGLQGRATNPVLGRGSAEDLFREHVAGLLEDAREAYLDLLDQVGWWASGAGCQERPRSLGARAPNGQAVCYDSAGCACG